MTLAKHSTSLSVSLELSNAKQFGYNYNHHPPSRLDTEVVERYFGITIWFLTWVTQRPGTIDKADVSGETRSEDAMGQRDQPAAPLVIPVLVATAEPSVEGKPGEQTAGHPHRQGEQHPAAGTDTQNTSESAQQR